MGKRLNPRRAKIHHSYTPADVALLFQVHRQTVRNWLSAGLVHIRAGRRILIRGSELRIFLEKRQASSKRRCPPGSLYCLRCREPRQPREGSLVIIKFNESSGNARALCSECGARMFRRLSLAKAAELGFSRAKFREADPHIDESAAPSLNCHLERTH